MSLIDKHRFNYESQRDYIIRRINTIIENKNLNLRINGKREFFVVSCNKGSNYNDFNLELRYNHLDGEELYDVSKLCLKHFKVFDENILIIKTNHNIEYEIIQDFKQTLELHKIILYCVVILNTAEDREEK